MAKPPPPEVALPSIISNPTRPVAGMLNANGLAEGNENAEAGIDGG